MKSFHYSFALSYEEKKLFFLSYHSYNIYVCVYIYKYTHREGEGEITTNSELLLKSN